MPKVIAVDFDGTIAEDAWPEIGPFRPGAVGVLKDLKAHGHQIILWTCREGLPLEKAVRALEAAGVQFDAENLPKYRHFGRKVYADVYIDDRAHVDHPGRKICWHEVRWALNDLGWLNSPSSWGEGE